MNSDFKKAYSTLNPAQKEAVDTIEGPVMVIAGPGTGKTQVLSLRIANILITQTDIQADGILCLTFTNSGVRAMKERLRTLIGSDAEKVTVKTFHAFAGGLLEEFFDVLGFDTIPKPLSDEDGIILIDSLLETHEWEYLRPRGGGARIFHDLKSLISLLKREGVSAKELEKEIDTDIARLESDPESISSRGPTKGEIKKTVLTKIQGLKRTREVVKFYTLYEEAKKEKNVVDYDDMIELAVSLVRDFEDIRATLIERHLYVLVDEHQDSSGLQNAFLEILWGDVEKPNLFVVGDDRQLIYGFGGASLSHFERFKETFEGTKVISLTENYRSTQKILDTAGDILKSSLVESKLKSNTKELHPVGLIEAEYPRDEIIAAGLAIKESGIDPSECAILVPKNAQVQTASTILIDLGLPVSVNKRESLFETQEAQRVVDLLTLLVDSHRSDAVARIVLARVPHFDAQEFIYTHRRNLIVTTLTEGTPEIQEIKTILDSVVDEKNIYTLIQKIGAAIFFESTEDHDLLIRQVSIVRTLLHLALSFMEQNPQGDLEAFLHFLSRLREYGHSISIASFNKNQGVKIMTLHGSKGLEYDFVWIAHMDQKSLMGGKRMGFSLPESLTEKVYIKDELTARRELYVAMTRARLFCNLSYATTSYSGATQELASIVPISLLEKKEADVTEQEILENDPELYVSYQQEVDPEVQKNILAYVREEYTKRKISVTHLNNFFACPWKWYFRNFVQLPEPENESLVYGNLVHGLLEVFFVEGKLTDEVYDQKLDALRVFDEPSRVRLKKQAKDSVEQYIDTYTGTKHEAEYKPRDREEAGFSVTGKIDLVEYLDGGVAVTDFKTNAKPLTRGVIEKRTEEGRMSDYLRQLAMYSYLLEGEKMEVLTSKLYFLEGEGSVYETHIEKEEIESLKQDIADFAEFLEGGKWIERECTEKECQYCELAARVGLV